MASVRDLAFLSDAVYNFEEVNGWIINKEFRKRVDGFQAALYYRGDEKVVAFCGSNDWTDWLRDNREIFTGRLPLQTRQAIEFFENIQGIKHGDCWTEDIYNRQEDTPTFNITVTGHSLGGILATIVGNKYALYTVAFNSPGTSGLQTRNYALDANGNIAVDSDSDEEAGYPIELKASEEARDKINNYIISNDSIGTSRTHYGHVYYARAYYDFTHLSAHSMDQWLLDRYDADGNFDPNKKINMELASIEALQGTAD